MVKENKAEQVGFHKGAIATLVKEREELVRIIKIIDALLGAHSAELNKLGAGSAKAVKQKS